jgi:hypothetical protein
VGTFGDEFDVEFGCGHADSYRDSSLLARVSGDGWPSSGAWTSAAVSSQPRPSSGPVRYAAPPHRTIGLPPPAADFRFFRLVVTWSHDQRAARTDCAPSRGSR